MAKAWTSIESSAATDGRFHTTRWGMVFSAQTADPHVDSQTALNELCTAYWLPLYVWTLRKGHDRVAAQDLTQAFFVHLLEGDALRNVDPGKGKFRSFLLASYQNFLANEHDKQTTLKRGGGTVFLPLDDPRLEAQFAALADGEPTPDVAYDRSWALTLIQRTLGLLRRDYADSGKSEQFALLQPYLSADSAGPPYQETAERMGMSLSGVKMAILRLRRRFGELIRGEIAHTVLTSSQIDEELEVLFGALAGHRASEGAPTVSPETGVPRRWGEKGG
ncbi:MAG: sigma-70 family RNA polymerase sigma factor [Verrucomicrobia bacterium]|nr:sigma-70 family RNA polymerase sigma factor [Verrucomicrobiota bacterium]MBI3867586.1 sigma-70 family RNA polymerase sigma factor [Verrucomicrobiota bacterium]